MCVTGLDSLLGLVGFCGVGCKSEKGEGNKGTAFYGCMG